MTEHDLLNWLTQNASPLTIALFALYLLRDEGRRNAAALQKIIDQYRQSIAALTDAIYHLTGENHHGKSNLPSVRD